MPFEKMLDLWTRFSANNENAFWNQTLAEYQRWLKRITEEPQKMTQEELQSMMERYPDG